MNKKIDNIKLLLKEINSAMPLYLIYILMIITNFAVPSSLHGLYWLLLFIGVIIYFITSLSWLSSFLRHQKEVLDIKEMNESKFIRFIQRYDKTVKYPLLRKRSLFIFRSIVRLSIDYAFFILFTGLLGNAYGFSDYQFKLCNENFFDPHIFTIFLWFSPLMLLFIKSLYLYIIFSLSDEYLLKALEEDQVEKARTMTLRSLVYQSTLFIGIYYMLVLLLSFISLSNSPC